MKKSFIFWVLIFIMIAGFKLEAAVWYSNNEWNIDWEKKYSNWVQSSNTYQEMFTLKSSPYYGVRVDCADTSYAFRAIFSYENQLPFKARNPVARPDGKVQYFSNELEAFDDINVPTKRLVKFLNYMNEVLSTETLSVNDSYPIDLKKIIPGDMFLYKVVSKKGATVRHTFNIKNINDTGTFDLIYSTQQLKKGGHPLNYKENQMLSHRPLYMHWGFKRFRNPDMLNTTFAAMGSSILKEELEFSLEQYSLAKTMSELEFFAYVKDGLASILETPSQMIERILKSVCDQATERIASVNEAIVYLTSIKNRCMDYTEFDTYSTPNRDRRIKELFEELKQTLETLNNENVLDQVNEASLELAQSIFLAKLDSEELTAKMSEFCPIKYKAAAPPILLNELYQKVFRGKLSFHPNDNLERRWGNELGNKTKCIAYYD